MIASSVAVLTSVVALTGLIAAPLTSNALATHGSSLHARSNPHHHQDLIKRLGPASSVQGQQKRTVRQPIISRNNQGTLGKRESGQVCRIRGTNATSTVYPSSAPTASSLQSVSAPTWTQSASLGPITTSTASWSSSAASAPSPTSSASVPVTIASDGSTACSNGKSFGLAWPNGDYNSPSDPGYVGNYIGNQAGWYYTWSPFNVPSADALGLEFVPMLWGYNQESDFSAAQSSWPSSVEYVLFLNEPNEASQSNIGAQDAVKLWQQHMSPLAAQGKKIGAAATTSAPSGLQWILDFFAACPSCAAETTFIPLHWYDTTPGNMITYVQNFHDKVQAATKRDIPIWITEYSCQNFNNGPQCTSDGTWTLHQQAVAFFQSAEYVHRWAPFGVMENMQGVNEDNALMSSSGSITDLGKWYIYSS